MTANPKTDGFTGWLRTPGAPWRPVVQEPTRDDALTELVRFAEQVPGVRKDLDLLPDGQKPVNPPAGRQP